MDILKKFIFIFLNFFLKNKKYILKFKAFKTNKYIKQTRFQFVPLKHLKFARDANK